MNKAPTSMLQTPNSKFQVPSSKESSSFNFQKSRTFAALGFETWNLELSYCLGGKSLSSRLVEA
jgi:hypothetical protein